MRYKIELKELSGAYLEYLKDESEVPKGKNNTSTIKTYGKFAEEESFDNEIVMLNIDYDNPDNVKKIKRGHLENGKVKLRITVGGLLFDDNAGLDRYLYKKEVERVEEVRKANVYQNSVGKTSTTNSSGYGASQQKRKLTVDEKNAYQCNIWILLGEKEEGFVYKKYEINGIGIDSYCEGFDEKEGNRIFSLVLNQREMLMTRNKVKIEVMDRKSRGAL